MPKDFKPATRDYTIVLHKRCQGVQFKKKAPKAIKCIKKFATEAMKTTVQIFLLFEKFQKIIFYSITKRITT